MLIAAVISLAALLALAGLFQFVGTWQDARRFPPPGRMVDIGGRRLHARVMGDRAPLVLFESGISASSVNWMLTQQAVAAFAATCSYDRAGLGWSDPPRGEFNAARMVSDLAALLDGIGVPGPFVLVGHSYGGLLVRLFAEQYPERVAALVLVDPVLACHWSDPDARRARIKLRGFQLARWGGRLASFGVVRLLTSPALISKVVLPRFAGKSANREGVVDRLDTELRKLPQETWPVIRAHWCRSKTFRAMTAHLAALEGTFASLQKRTLPTPITVISAGNTPPEGLAEHRNIAGTSGEHIVAEGSGHWVQLDQPQLVIDAIRRVLERCR